MNLETINKWLDEKYGCSYTRLEELHDFYFEKYIDLQQENKNLKERIGYLERSNDRREVTILEQIQEISDLEDNWNKLKEYVLKKQAILFDTEYICYSNILDKMQELESGDNNVCTSKCES